MSNYKTPEDNLTDFYLSENFQIDNYVSGELWIWGKNTSGTLGDNTTTNKSSPIQLGNSYWKHILISYNFCEAIKEDGSLWTWGSNINGRLGDGTTTNRSSPVQVGSGLDWKSIATGLISTHGAGIKNDGSLWLWGDNTYGQLGDNTTTNKSSPVQTIMTGKDWKEISVSANTSYALREDGTLWSYGYNNVGQLGTNDRISYSSPTQVVGGESVWKHINSGKDFAIAIRTDGSLWAWGDNTYGQLGDNSIINKSSPVQTTTAGNDWKQVAAGYYHTAAIKTNGTLWTWGRNNVGQLGDGTIVDKSSPIQISGSWKQVVCGENMTAGIKTDGSLWLWGDNSSGTLGDNTTTNRSSPVQSTKSVKKWKSVSGSLSIAGIVLDTY